jgi:high affinity Mn2+ porin
MNRKIVSFAFPLIIVILFAFTGLMPAQDHDSVPTVQSNSWAGGTAGLGLRDELKLTDNRAPEIGGDFTPTAPVNSPTAPPPASPALPPTAESGESSRQNWGWHAQSTMIVQGYPGLRAGYSGPNSLPTRGEARETISMDVYSGFRLWNGAEAHFDLLTWQGFGLNDTLGIEAFPNGEAYKAGTSFPRSNIARLFIRQTVGFHSPGENFVDGDELKLAGKQDVSRLTLTIGRFSIKDIFDNNAYANDPRTQFMNWALMANAAWDYPSDALGYTTGAAVELNQPGWSLRYGFFQIDRLRNAWTSEDQFFTWPGYKGAGDGAPLRDWGMVSELERRYSANTHPGTIRFLSYLNQGRFGSYQAALSIPGADISQTRAYRSRYGFGLNWEQEITRNIGLFSRIGWNDGHNEAWMFTDINHSASLGVSVKGESWRRPHDTFGLAGVSSGISHVNQEFLAAGGTGILDGDGTLNYGSEKVLETYYDFKVSKMLRAAVDYQWIDNPAFNQARGPIQVFGTRLHWEF